MANIAPQAQEIRKSSYGKETRHPIVRAVEKKLVYEDIRMDAIEEKHGTRVTGISLQNVSGDWRLVVTRANGH